MFNDQGDEYYSIIPRVEGKAHRENRYKSLEALEGAINRGDQPGEVVRENV
jgi:hypothetical protein